MVDLRTASEREILVFLYERVIAMEANLTREVGEMGASVSDFIDFVQTKIGEIQAQLTAALEAADVAGQQAAAQALDDLQTRIANAKAAMAGGTPAPTPADPPEAS